MATPAVDTHRQILPTDEVPFGDLGNDFERAIRAHGGRQFELRIADFDVCIRVVGSEWADAVAAAMGHLQRRGSGGFQPELAIDVWDIGATGIAVSKRATRDPSAPPILMRGSQDGRFVGEERHHGMTWLDRRGNRIIGFTQCATRLNLDERARPFHKMLSAWLEDRGVQFVHSGLIRHAGRGILFVGNGGAGKSTSSIACLRAGMGYLGDDFIGLGVKDDCFVGYGFYASCLLNVHHIERFPDLKPLGHAPNHSYEEKCVLYLTDAFAHCLRERSTIDALVLPKVVDSETTSFRRATPVETLKAIAPTSVMMLPRPNRAAFERLVQLVQTTPGYWLELGRRVDLIPDAVCALAQSLPVPQPQPPELTRRNQE